jgi:glycosyltransferase involved in cell wall biosynthesis
VKILHVLPAYLPAVRYGGPVVAVHALCRELAARGHAVEVMTTNIDGPGVGDVPIGEPVWRDGVKLRYFASPVLRRLFFAPAMAPALRRDIATFDIVHLHTLYQWPTWAAARAARAWQVPYVLSPRGMLVQDLIRRRSRLAKSLWIAAIERRNLEGAAALHATSPLEADEFARFGWTLPPVTVIANGVDDPVAAAHPVAADVVAAVVSGGPVVLYLGRLSWKKGLDRLLRAFARVEMGMLVMAGTDDEGLGAGLVALARELGIGGRVRVVPRTMSGADKEYLFRAAQVFVAPSYSENFGNTVLEAMRRGVPVVTTPEVGASAIVRAAQAGIITDGAAGPLSAAIARLVGDAGLARTMGAAGQRHVVAHYGWGGVAAQMERLYASICA